jgi:hypothetical protein
MTFALEVAPDQFGLLRVVFGDEEAGTHTVIVAPDVPRSDEDGT